MLTFTTHWFNSADDKLIYFLIFPRKQDLTCLANCLQWRKFAWNVKTGFLGKIRKIFQYVVCWKFYPNCSVTCYMLYLHCTYHKQAMPSCLEPRNNSPTRQHVLLHLQLTFAKIAKKKKNTFILTFTTLWANSADDKLMIWWYFFFIFPRKQDQTFHANCLHWRKFAWKSNLFSGKN